MEYGTLRITFRDLEVPYDVAPFSYLDLISGEVPIEVHVYEHQVKDLMRQIESKRRP